MVFVKERGPRKWKKTTPRQADIYKTEIEAVTVNPMELASAAYGKMKSKLTAFLETDAWPDIMKAIPREVWRKLATELGPGRFAQGVRVKGFKVDNFWTGWGPLMDTHLTKILALPDETVEERETRMLENKRGLVVNKGKWRRAS